MTPELQKKIDQAVKLLQGRKTMTRRIVPNEYVDDLERGLKGTPLAKAYLDGRAYRVGEVVAVAQSYETLANCGHLDEMLETSSTFKKEYCGAGWSNKMFVRADLMPHQIRITDIKVERLQDISDYDCAKEGVFPSVLKKESYHVSGITYGYQFLVDFSTPRDAFSALIDKVSGKGTWAKNPWVFCYSFELVK